MRGSSFTFRLFEVRQDRCAMKVGTDGVLLGAWAEGADTILDIGTGTGLIAMMMAQRFAGAQVVAAEIDPEAAAQAASNASASPFGSRISVEATAIQQLGGGRRFGAIVSNPPYFTSSLRTPDSQRATARHADTLTYRELMAAVARLMADDGVFSAVIPSECLDSFVAEAYMAGLVLSRRCDIRTTPRKEPKRHLVAFRRAGFSGPRERTEECLQDADGTRSEWYAALTSGFYIK